MTHHTDFNGYEKKVIDASNNYNNNITYTRPKSNISNHNLYESIKTNSMAHVRGSAQLQYAVNVPSGTTIGSVPISLWMIIFHVKAMNLSHIHTQTRKHNFENINRTSCASTTKSLTFRGNLNCFRTTCWVSIYRQFRCKCIYCAVYLEPAEQER